MERIKNLQYRNKNNRESHRKRWGSIDFLNNTISIEQLSHEMRLGKFGEQVVLKSQEAFDNNLRQLKKGIKSHWEQMGLSQSGLAKETGISIKTIQAYEQGLKNIKHAKWETVEILSKVLACEIEDLY